MSNVALIHEDAEIIFHKSGNKFTKTEWADMVVGMMATKSNSYTFQKDGIWYFSRRVPADLRRHYRTGRIAYSLRTKSIRDARVRAMSDAAKLDRHQNAFSSQTS